MKNLIIEENSSSNYRNRTEENAKKSDLTIAIALYFDTAGERLTKDIVIKSGKKYIAIIPEGDPIEKANKVVDKINEMCLPQQFVLNIAGNGIHTLGGKMNQLQADEFTYELIKNISQSPKLISKIGSIRTGGQTGFDESGAKAGLKLGFKTTVHLPKGFKIRNQDGVYVAMSEEHAKMRFVEVNNRKRIYIDMDDTICDYSGLWTEYKKIFPDVAYPQSKFGFFSRLKPIKGALESIKELGMIYDIYILTRPSIKNLHSYSEKAEWVEKYLGEEFLEKLILCPDKSLVKGDYLIDDYDQNGQLEFGGEFIHFKTEKYPDWDYVLRYFKNI